ncbi:MAG: fumarylacetoacetate hydrolase family protein [Nitrospiraceae bacterium]|nr:MAG: fumarylacetoacetate hydrolase family protein [Nitrospiraceae bacterium]
MKLIRFGDPHQEKPGIILENGKRYDTSLFGEDYSREFFETGGISRLQRWLGTLPGRPSDTLPPVDASLRLGPPVYRPGAIVCVGFNYKDHARETGRTLPSEPVFFLKAPSSLSGPGDDVRIPRGSSKTDWEVELAVVIGRKASYVPEDKALGYVAGFVLFNDYSEREFQFTRGGQWVKGKSADTFGPLGPFLATPDEVPDYRGLRMWLRVNGAVMQESSTANMYYDVPALIACISRYMTLLPGDIVSTGTPAGVGHGRKPPEYLKEGDIVEYGIDGLGQASQKIIVW